MTFVADEGVDSAIVAKLRDEKHQVFYVAEMAPGTTDDEVLDQANAQQALLVTADKDFGELVFRLGRIYKGVVLLRLYGLSPDSKAKIVIETVQLHGATMLDAFTVISHSSVRVRSKLQP